MPSEVELATRSFLPSRVTIASVAVLLAISAAFSGTVEIRVVEKGGRPIVGQALAVHPPLAPGQPWWSVDHVGRKETGLDGRAVFEGVAEGRYTVSMGAIVDPNLISPADNPQAPLPVFTVGPAGAPPVVLTIELWRGVVLTSYVVVDRGETPRARLVLRSLDGPATVAVPVSESGYCERTLVPGRWEAGLEIPAGYLLVGLEQNGEPLQGATARLDLLDDPRSQRLTWSLSARALITGTSRSTAGGCAGFVTATLIAPGPWLADAMARGGSEFQRVAAQSTTNDCVYKLWLPDGTWRVAVEGPEILESIPESVEVSLSPGDTKVLNFTARKSDDQGGANLSVEVQAPDGTPLPQAAVEIWPAQRKADQKPVATAMTKDKSFRPFAEFRDLADGDYRIVAGHAEYLESTLDLPGFEKAGKPKRVTVKLRDGARVHAHATNELGAMEPAVHVDIVRSGDPPKSELADESIAAKKRAVHLVTDNTGQADSWALPPGTYRLNARKSGDTGGAKFVYIVDGGGRLHSEQEIKLQDASVDVELKAVPAPSITGSIACVDGGALPAQASFRVFPASESVPDPWQTRELNKATLALDDIRLTGDRPDRFRVGPLSAGAYRLAVRPQGHEYWNWAPGVLVPEQASVVSLLEASTTELGVVPLECSPVVLLSPRVGTGEAVPDFRDAEFVIDLRRSGERDGSKPLPFEIDEQERRSLLLGLPQGKVELAIVVKHPYLIPASLTVPRQELDLLRGKLAVIPLPFETIGGLVEVRGTGAAARLAASVGEPIVRPLVAGRASFPGTPVGNHRVELCTDLACGDVVRTWERVAVAAARTVTVGEGP